MENTHTTIIAPVELTESRLLVFERHTCPRHTNATYMKPFTTVSVSPRDSYHILKSQAIQAVEKNIETTHIEISQI
jgi:hypothetical protein